MASEIINSHSDIISFVVTTNTIGNALFVDVENEMAMIAPKVDLEGSAAGLSSIPPSPMSENCANF